MGLAGDPGLSAEVEQSDGLFLLGVPAGLTRGVH